MTRFTTLVNGKKSARRKASERRPSGRNRFRPRLLLEQLEERVLPTNTAVLSTTLPTVVNTAGSALSFNGNNDYVITPEFHSAFPTTSVTIELWFKANSAGVIVSEVGQAAINSGWHDSQLEIESSGQVNVRVWNLSSVSLG